MAAINTMDSKWEVVKFPVITILRQRMNYYAYASATIFLSFCICKILFLCALAKYEKTDQLFF